MNLILKPYLSQVAQWPQTGNQLLAQFDAETIIVYQAYNPAIGHFAASHGYFGGEFSLSRATWIKPGFLWMMYRSGWGTKLDQEVTLAVRLKRSAFDTILSQAVHSRYIAGSYDSAPVWKAQLQASPVVVQWDPDHDPTGAKVQRRAIQLGLRRDVVEQYARDWIVEIEDISEFVSEQQANVEKERWPELVIPAHMPYPVTDPAVRARLEIS
jgi:hypothetical protein